MVFRIFILWRLETDLITFFPNEREADLNLLGLGPSRGSQIKTFLEPIEAGTPRR